MVQSGKAKGQSIKVTGTRFLIGRDPECQLRPLSPEVSERHAELKIVGGFAVLVDLDSRTGTRVNGRKLTGPVSLRTGDQIGIGPLCFTAVVDDKKPQAKAKAPTRPRRTTEDMIASWLTVEDDDDAPRTTIPPPRPRPSAERPRPRADAGAPVAGPSGPAEARTRSTSSRR
jgi:predicted component of type VI protein secretion system